MKISATLLAVWLLAGILNLPGLVAAKDTSYIATVEFFQEANDDDDDDEVEGYVFEDINRDGKRQEYEPGIPGIMVSNGLDVVLTDEDGEYELDNIQPKMAPGAMTIFITKPAGYEVPVDENNVPQFFYHHIPGGTPLNMRGYPFRFGGLPDTGPLPEEINFPLIKGEYQKKFKAAFSGDTQTYNNLQVGYLRDTLAKELSEMPDVEFIMVEGDVLGDDLGLFPRYKEVMSAAQMPLYLVPGNHDLDFDAASDANSLDTFKREWGPADYSFDIGDVHFVVIDDMDYPCKAVSNKDGLHPGCDDDILSSATYNGIINERQLKWLRNDLKYVPKEKLIVVNLHIPTQSFLAQNSVQGGQIDNPADLYEAVGCMRATDGSFPPENCTRPVLVLYGHIHTTSNVRPGESYEGWVTKLDSGNLPPGRAVPNVPVPTIDTGAACGAWWDGDLDSDRIPTSWQRMGAPKGYYLIEFDGNTFVDTYKASGKAMSEQMSLSILSPTFEKWFDELIGWWNNPNGRPGNEETPPVNINDLGDTKIILNEELAKTKLVANVWNGTKDSIVEVSIDGSAPLTMTRTQPGTGEGILVSLDPYQLKQTLQIARYAFRSTSGDDDAQGYERFRGSKFGPADPRPSTFNTASNHLWTVAMPAKLQVGIHVAKVTTVDVHGRKFSETLVFEVRDKKPAPYFRSELFEITP